MASRLLALSLAAAFLLPLATAQAPSDGAPTAPDWLDGRVAATFDGVTTASLAGTFAVHKVSLQGTTRNAQELRQAYLGAAAFGAQELFLEGVESALRARIEGLLGSAFPQARVILATVSVDRASLAAAPAGADGFHPPVQVVFAGSSTLDLAALGYKVAGEPLDEADLRTALDLGAVARLPYNLTANPGWNVTFAFTMPAWVRLGQAEGGALSADQRTATWSLENWRGTGALRLPAALVLAGRDAPAADAPSDAKVEVGIDMVKVDRLTLPGLLRRDFGALLVDFEATVQVGALRLADFPALEQQVRARLPASIAIEGLNADGLRLAVDRGLLPASTLDEVEAYLQDIAAARAGALVPGGVALEGGFGPGALDAAHVSQPLDGSPPLMYHVAASFRIPLAAEASRLSAATGPVLFSRDLSFAVPRVQGLDTTYRIALPQGIAITGVSADGAGIARSTEGGRDVVLVTPERDDARATFTVAVTAEFALAQFWYVWVGALLLLALAVAVLLWRRQRKRAKPASSVEPEPAPSPPVAAPAAEAADAVAPAAKPEG